MKRPLFWCSLLFLSGIYIKYFLPQVTAAVLFIPVAMFPLVFIIKSRKLYPSFMAFLIAVSFFSGISVMEYKNLPKNLDSLVGRTVKINAKIEDVPETKKDYTVYYCRILNYTYKDTVYPSNEKIKLTHRNVESVCDFGDVFTAKCKITKPSAQQNRGGFDYGLYLKTKDIFFTGYINDEKINVVSKNNYNTLDHFKLLNMHLCEKIDAVFDEENALFLKAMLLGDKSEMPPSYYASFKKSGLSHVIAVSGMHLSYVVMLLFILQKIFKINKRFFSFFSICFIICFMILTGMSPSIVRASIMMGLVLCSDVFIKRSDRITSLCFAAALITAFNPYVAFSASFILSFTATFGIVMVANPFEKNIMPSEDAPKNNVFIKAIKTVVSVIAVSFSAQLMTFPFTSYMFNEITLWTLPANLIITPFCPLILALGFIFCILSVLSLSAAKLLAIPLTFILKVARFIINGFSSMEFGIIPGCRTDFFFMSISLFIILSLLLILYKRKKELIFSLSVLIVLLSFGIVNSYRELSEAKVSFINVGQGDSAVITLPNQTTILIDGGQYDYQGESDTDSSTLCSYLKKRGIKNIDFCIASHPHDDHTGGLFAVLDSFKVGKLIIPDKFAGDEVGDALLKKAAFYKVPVYTFGSGDSLNIGEKISFKALMPDDYVASHSEVGNNTSLVLRFDYYETSFLFTGDIEEDTEKHLCKNIRDELLDIDVLKVAHHGSKTSTTDALLLATTPDFAFIPVGKNTFGHPSGEVIGKLEANGTKVFRADLNRDVVFSLSEKGIDNIIYN